MNVEYKYDIGETIFYKKMKSVPMMGKCDTCDGEGIILRLDKKELQCPVCKGSKIIDSGSGSVKEVIYEDTVVDVHIDIFDENKNIRYKLKNYNFNLSEYELYSDKEELSKKLSKAYMGYSK